MWKVRLFLLSLLCVGALVAAAPMAAVTGNWQRDFEHPFVGLVVLYEYDEEGNLVFAGRCSGSLLNEWTVLTAGHCVEGADAARVYFQQDAGAGYDPALGYDPVTGYPEFCAPGTEALCATSDELYNYGFDNFAGFPDIRDVGLIILDTPVELSEYGVLAAPESGLDELATQRGRQDITFTSSGYGLTSVNPVKVESYRERLMARAQLVNLRSSLTDGFNIQLTANRGDGKGGTCSGDSGGPIFYGGFESNLIVAVNSFGLNPWCRGVDFAYRVDRAEVLAWILAHAKEPGTIQVVPLS